MTTKFRQKITQNCTNLNSVQVIEEFFTCIVGFMGFVNSNLLLNFPGYQGSCHGNQIWANLSHNCTDSSSVQEIEEIFA